MIPFLNCVLWLVLSARPIRTIAQSIQSNDTAPCGASDVNPTAACWNVLNVTQYLDNWWAENEATCNGNASYKDGGFAICYQLLHNIRESYCNDISIQRNLNFEYPNWTPQEYYVLQSMYNLWYWYTSIWFAIEDATLITDLNANEIVQTINPVNPGDTSLGVLLSALSAGFAFLALPAGFGNIGTKFAATAIGQSPGLAKGMLPSGSLNSEFTQLAEIESALGMVLSEFQGNLVNTLSMAMFDYTSFSTLVSDGAFIPEKDDALNASVTTLTSVLKTFIVSQSLQANNIILTVARLTSPYNITNNLTNNQGLFFENPTYLYNNGTYYP